jgi:hypothetical protein
VSRDHPYRGLRHRRSEREFFHFKSGEAARESYSSVRRRTGGRDRKDLANSEVRRVKVQNFGAPSCKWRNREGRGTHSRTTRWAWEVERWTHVTHL